MNNFDLMVLNLVAIKAYFLVSLMVDAKVEKLANVKVADFVR